MMDLSTVQMPGSARADNAIAGPSGLNTSNTVSSTGTLDPPEPTQKKPRIWRSKQACHSCRITKRKCGGQPPDPCPNCIHGHNECSWPVEDGRSSSARREKARAKLGQRQSVGDAGTTMPTPAGWGMGDAGWMNALGDLGFDPFADPTPTGGSTGAATGHPVTFDFGDYANSFNLNDAIPTPSTFPPPMHPSQATSDLPDWSGDFDPFQLILAMSSRMPTIEQHSANDETSPMSAQAVSDPAGGTKGKGKYVKVTWWRPHGQTAIAPGLKKMTLKVRLDDGSKTVSRSPMADDSWLLGPTELFGPNRAPSALIMRHLMILFEEHFGSQLPFLDFKRLQEDLDAGNGQVFLLNCIAACAARFSTNPAIALPGVKPHQYGDPFYKVAKDMLGSMLSVPSRETVVALLLLCYVGFGNDSEAEEWMFAGMAVRLAVDLGLHLDPPEEAGIGPEERRLNRLVFWSVVLLDFALAFGTGRQPTFRVDEITQCLPRDEDVAKLSGPDPLSHPFPYAVKQMFSYGYLIETLNSRKFGLDADAQQEIQRARILSIKEYAQLPLDLKWNVTNLQKHARAGQAPIYLQLHLWMHTIIASGYLTGTDYLRREHGRPAPSIDVMSGAVTPGGLAASNVWRNSARTIGDILVLSDIVCPKAYLSLPFVNQAFYVAGSCYVKELEEEREKQLAAQDDDDENPDIPSIRSVIPDDNGNSTELFKSILTSVSTENIVTLRKGLARQTEYWSGVAWVAEALEQRIRGIGASEIDLASVTEKLASIASVPDAGLLHRSGGEQVGADSSTTSQVFQFEEWLRSAQT